MIKLPRFWMRRAGPQAGDKPSRVPDLFGHVLAAAFIAAAAAVAMQMAYAAGSDDARRWTMVGIVAAGMAIVACGPGLTLGRGRIMAAICLSPVWLAAVGYNGVSALEYFDRHLSDAEARSRIKADAFREARDELQRLRQRREAVKTQRDATTIEGELQRTSVKREAERLAVELDEARARDKMDADIRVAATRLSGTEARGDMDTNRHLAPVFAWLSGATGVTVASSKDLRSLLLLLITEMGAALVPVAMALASRRPKPIARTSPSDPPPVPEPKPAIPSSIERADARLIMTWMDVRTVRVPGGRAEASGLYADYSAWMEGRGQTPATKTRFGSVLSEMGGLAKRKAGANWTVNYLGIELKPSAPVRPRMGGLMAIAGGRAS